jgi:hypothetical protein
MPAEAGRSGRWRFTPRQAALPQDGLPADAWTGFLATRSDVASTHEGARPFSVAEQQRILTVGACLSCHAGDSAPMRAALRDFAGAVQRRKAVCALAGLALGPDLGRRGAVAPGATGYCRCRRKS